MKIRNRDLYMEGDGIKELEAHGTPDGEGYALVTVTDVDVEAVLYQIGKEDCLKYFDIEEGK